MSIGTRGALFWASSRPLQTSLMVVLQELNSNSNTGIKQLEQTILSILGQMGIFGSEINKVNCWKQFHGEELFLSKSPIPIK